MPAAKRSLASLCLVAVLLIIGWTSAALGELKVNNSSRIVILGDSITDGDVHRLLVRDALHSVGLEGASVFNAGVGGNTAAQMLDRFRRDVLVYKPHIVTINAGVNDSGRPIPLEDFARDIEAMIELAGNRAIVLVTPTPIGEAGHPQMREYVVAYANWMRKYASEHGMPLADAHANLAQAMEGGQTVLEADHVHPNLAGQRLIARAILDALGQSEAVVPDRPSRDLYPGTIQNWHITGADKGAMLTDDAAAALNPMEADFLPLHLPQPPGDAGEWTEFARAKGVGMSLPAMTGKQLAWCVATWDEPKRVRTWLHVGGTITTLYLNGTEIELNPGNGWHPGKQRVRVLLNAGENRIVAETSSDLWVGIDKNRFWD